MFGNTRIIKVEKGALIQDMLSFSISLVLLLLIKMQLY